MRNWLPWVIGIEWAAILGFSLYKFGYHRGWMKGFKKSESIWKWTPEDMMKRVREAQEEHFRQMDDKGNECHRH